MVLVNVEVHDIMGNPVRLVVRSNRMDPKQAYTARIGNDEIRVNAKDLTCKRQLERTSPDAAPSYNNYRRGER